jgi:hypothetical protein
MFPAVKGPGSRKTKKNLFHRYLAWKDVRYPAGDARAGQVVPWHRPRLRFQQRCRHAIRTIPALPVDPDRPEDDIDTGAEDHPYDGACNVLMAAPPIPERDEVLPLDGHPGVDPKRKRRNAHESVAQRMTREAMERYADGAGDEPARMPREEDYVAVEDF